MPERECEAGEAAIEAVEKVVVRVCRSVLGGLVQAATGRELFSSAGKLVNDFFVDVVATRLMQASSAMAFQVLPLLVDGSRLVQRCTCVAWGAMGAFSFLGRRFTVESFGLCMRWMKKPVPDHAVQWSAVCVLVLSN